MRKSNKVRVRVLDERRLYTTPFGRNDHQEDVLRFITAFCSLLLHVVDELSTRYFTIVVRISFLN